MLPPSGPVDRIEFSQTGWRARSAATRVAQHSEL